MTIVEFSGITVLNRIFVKPKINRFSTSTTAITEETL
jgi:hypothetical protein